MVYDPRIGRFLSPDPTGEAGGLNVYEYAKNDPIDWDDPSGLAPQPNWNAQLNLTDAEGYALTDSKALATGIAELQARIDFHYNNIHGLYGQSSANIGTDRTALGYYQSEIQRWKGQYSQIAGEANISSADIYAAEVAGTIGGAGREMGAKAADFGNDILYLESGGELGSSNQNLSQVSQLQASGQTTVLRATLAATPVIGNGYNLIEKEDLLTGQAISGVDRVAAGFGLASDVIAVGVGGKALLDRAPVAEVAPPRRVSLTDRILDNPTCFIAGTQVVRALELEEQDSPDSGHGGQTATQSRIRYVTQSIETLKPGDRVLARDQYEQDGPAVLRRVEQVFQRTAYGLTIINIRSSTGLEQTLYSTNEHPIFVPGRGWMICRELREGDQLAEASGAVSTVASARYKRYPTGITVHNFRVANSHTYFVREQGSTAEPVWVHNADYSTAARAARADMLAEDMAELDPHEKSFYSAPHANSLESLAPAQGYVLEDTITGEPLRYGMTTLGEARYSLAELNAMGARMKFIAEGSVAEMRAWETKQILDYLAATGERPPLNFSNH